MVRRISVENLTDGAHRLVFQRVAYRLQHSLRHDCIAGDAIDGEAERPEKPSPNRPLMIAAVAFQDAAAIARMVCGAVGSQRAQSVRREKMVPADPHDSRLIVRREWTVWQAD